MLLLKVDQRFAFSITTERLKVLLCEPYQVKRNEKTSKASSFFFFE